MNKQDVLTLYEYNTWANTRTLDAVEALSAGDFVRDLKSSFPSVRDTLMHIVGAEWAWLRRWQGESPSKLLSVADFLTLASVKDRFAAVDRDRRVFLEGLAEDRLAQPFSYKDLAGNAYSLLLIQSLQHVVNHGTYHRGQITTMLRQLGAKPMSTDMSRFYLERSTGT